MGQNVIIFWLFEGPWGPFNDQTGPILLPSYPSTHIYICTCKIRKKSDKNFLNSNPKYEKKKKKMGGPGGPYVETKVTKFSGQYDLITDIRYNKGNK